MTAKEIVREALAEDIRSEGRNFDIAGFFNFNPEESPETVLDAWRIYDEVVYGGKDPALFGVIPMTKEEALNS